MFRLRILLFWALLFIWVLKLFEDPPKTMTHINWMYGVAALFYTKCCSDSSHLTLIFARISMILQFFCNTNPSFSPNHKLLILKMKRTINHSLWMRMRINKERMARWVAAVRRNTIPVCPVPSAPLLLRLRITKIT